MKQRFILFRRAGIYYSEDTTTRKQSSLRTKNEGEALAILHSKNESFRQPNLNLQIARAYLLAQRGIVFDHEHLQTAEIQAGHRSTLL